MGITITPMIARAQTQKRTEADARFTTTNHIQAAIRSSVPFKDARARNSRSCLSVIARNMLPPLFSGLVDQPHEFLAFLVGEIRVIQQSGNNLCSGAAEKYLHQVGQGRALRLFWL